jgi:cysteinyl-tRNA synthetase
MKKSILYLLILLACGCKKDTSVATNPRAQMRDFVTAISAYTKAIKPSFAVIPQNGIELITENGEVTGPPSTAYLNAIDGNGQEDLYYGYENDNQATGAAQTNYLLSFLNLSKNAGNKILAIDYCSTPLFMDNSYQQNENNGFISFAANHRALDNIPDYPVTLRNENADTIRQLSQVKNFLYLINLSGYNTRAEFINAVAATNYDALVTDLFFNDGVAFTAAEVEQLSKKANGGIRMVICYMSIGEAENYRYYWQNSWATQKPAWLDAENPNWPGNYKVKYWTPEWQSIIYGNSGSYAKKIVDAGFSGVYLDIIDAFEYYE